MKQRYILGAVLILLVVGALVYIYGGSETPAGQAPLERLTPKNLADFSDAFNAAQDDVRVVLLLSPT